MRPTVGTSGANLAVLAAHRDGRLVCERPYYAPLPHTATGLGMPVDFVDRDPGGRLDPEAVAAAIGPDTSLVALTSPNNPTGQAADADTLRHIAEAAEQHDAVVLVDQVYRELTDHVLGATVHERIISTAGLNKCWGAPGLRAGWMIGDPRRMETMEEVHRLLLLGPSSPGARLATALLPHAATRRAALEARLAANHGIYEHWADQRGIAPATGMLTAFPDLGTDARAVAAAAAKQGILVLPGDVFGRPGHVRIGLGIPSDQLRAALAAFAW